MEKDPATRWFGEDRRGQTTHAHKRADIIMVDHDPATGGEIIDLLAAEGTEVRLVTTVKSALEQASSCLVVIHRREVTERSSYELIERLHESHPNLPVIVVSAENTIESVIDALRAGAYDFIALPATPKVFAVAVRRAAAYATLLQELEHLRTTREVRKTHFIGSSHAIQTLTDLVGRVAHTDVSVLIQGETGTGKELVARAIHEESSRKQKPFVAINCAAVPATLLESELFGHVRGAYTDAKQGREGIFVQASTGTLLLDEVGDMTLEMQAKLLRALQERVVRPVGANADVPFDTRVLCATHRDLEQLVESGKFRRDLFYRLNVVTVDVPALRVRGNDVIELATSFLARAAVRHGQTPLSLSHGVAERLFAYDWPGNVRELENCVERIVALARATTVSVDDLPARIQTFRSNTLVSVEDPREIVSLVVLEERYINHVIKLLDGNKSRAADMLGIDRRTLYRRLEKYHEDRARATSAAAAPPPVSPAD